MEAPTTLLPINEDEEFSTSMTAFNSMSNNSAERYQAPDGNIGYPTAIAKLESNRYTGKDEDRDMGKVGSLKMTDLESGSPVGSPPGSR